MEDSGGFLLNPWSADPELSEGDIERGGHDWKIWQQQMKG